MDAFLVSLAVVTLGEIGDKTQLLAFMLAARCRKPWAITAGIAVATLANHTLAASLGAWVAAHVAPDVLRWVVGGLFVAIGLWALVPDRMDEAPTLRGGLGVFALTVVTFFLAEMGDKTQVATAVLAARFDALAAVIAGTTLGMLVADVPAVVVADRFASRIPERVLKWARVAAALLFVAIGAATILGLPF